MACDMTARLHDEVLAHIFSHLDPLGILAASSVCRRWMDIINDCPGLLDDVCVRFTDPRGLELFSNMIRNFCCFCFDHMFIDWNIILFLQKFGPKFRSLSFKDNKVAVNLEHPRYKISNLVNLLELKIYCSQVEGVFSNLPKLKSLHLGINNLFFNGDIRHVDKITPFDLTDLKIGAPFFLDPIFPFENHNMYPEVEDFIKKRRSTLRSLDLTGMPYVDTNIAHMMQIEGLRLKHLKLPRYFELENTFQTFSTSQRGIVKLDLEGVYLDDHHIVMICNALPRLEKLNVSSCCFFNESVEQIFQLKYLRRLDLSGCKGIWKMSFRNALRNIACRELNVLKLHYLNIDNNILSRLLSLLPNLRKLTLSDGYDLNSRWVKCPETIPSGIQTYLYR